MIPLFRLLRSSMSVPLVLSAAVLATVVTVRGQGPAAAAQPAPTPMTAEEEEAFAVKAEALAYKVCDECHALDEVSAIRRTARDWRNSVASMTAKGAIATKDQLATITQYLTRYFGVVNVNTAPAEDLAAVLGLSPKDALAVVEHRKVVGKYADAAALLAVPGIAKAKIEEQPDALKFD